jgi:8-oxo-dGTP pyrophosphatase MutT (NUDIX family)
MAEWMPHVTVAAVVERQGRFLLVEEHTPLGLCFNQPAGHLDQGESLIEAVIRETLEETAYHFVPEALVGVYLWTRPDGEITYLRFAFTGQLTGFEPDRALDTGIVRADWFSLDEIAATRVRHRSPLIEQCVLDYQAGRRCSLDLLNYYPVGAVNPVSF